MTISEVVNAIFTNARGFSAANRTAITTYMTANVATLIDSDTAAEDFVQAYTNALRDSTYGPIEKGNPDTWQLFLDCCEDVINIEKGTSVPSGYQRLVLRLTQAGTSAPVVEILGSNPFSAITPVRDAAGRYLLNFADPIADSTENIVINGGVTIPNNGGTILAGTCSKASTSQIVVRSAIATTETGDNPQVVKQGALADDLLSGFVMYIEVFEGIS